METAINMRIIGSTDNKLYSYPLKGTLALIADTVVPLFSDFMYLWYYTLPHHLTLSPYVAKQSFYYSGRVKVHPRAEAKGGSMQTRSRGRKLPPHGILQ